MGVDGKESGGGLLGTHLLGSEEGDPCIVALWAVRFHHTGENSQGCHRRWEEGSDTGSLFVRGLDLRDGTMDTIPSIVNISMDCRAGTASARSYPITAIPGQDAVVLYKLINGGCCMCQRIVEEESYTGEYYQDSLPCERIVLSPKDFSTITDHLESVEPVDNPGLKNLFTRYSK